MKIKTLIGTLFYKISKVFYWIAMQFGYYLD